MTNDGGWRGRTAGGAKCPPKKSSWIPVLPLLPLATLVLLWTATEDHVVVASAHYSEGAGEGVEVEVDADGTTSTSTARKARRTTDGVAGGGSGESDGDDDANLLLLPPLLGALFGGETASDVPIPALADAWESHPLLATSRRPPPSECETDTDSDDDGGCPSTTAAAAGIPTVHRSNRDLDAAIRELLDLSDDSSTAIDDPSPLLGLGVDEVFSSILSQPNLSHGLGQDFTVLKKIVRDGQEWSGIVPKDVIPADEARGAVAMHGFSLVINKVEERWGPAARFARTLEMEAMPSSVSCNLYLTPGATAEEAGGGPADDDRVSGFEVHFDWMDVLVIQISGKKTWTVATSSPLAYLPPPDLKRKPTPKEVRAYALGDGDGGDGSPPSSRYDDFVLRPGDALYVPRGFMHNASTVDFADEPSLHLTFGLEHHCRTTVEALVHHALLLFYGGDNDDGGSATDVAVPGDECSGGVGVTWLDLLDLSVADVVRRDCVKIKPGGGGGDGAAEMAVPRDRGCGMRRSVPLHPAWRRMLGGRERNRRGGGEGVARGGTTAGEEDEHDPPPTTSTSGSTTTTPIDDDVIWTMYADGLDAYRRRADLGGAIGFPRFLRTSPEVGAKFCLPTRDVGAAIDAIVACESALPRFVSEDRFGDEVERFYRFARDRDRLRAALGAFERGTSARRMKAWEDEKSALEAVGHGQYA